MVDITALIVLLIITNCLVISFNLWAWVDRRLKRKKRTKTKRREVKQSELEE